MSRQIKIGSVIRRSLGLYACQAPVLLPAVVLSVLLPMAAVVVGLGALFGGSSALGSSVLASVALIVIVLAIVLFTAVVIGLVADVRAGTGEVGMRRRLRSVSPAVAGKLALVGIIAGLAISALFSVGQLLVLALIVGVVTGSCRRFGVGFGTVGIGSGHLVGAVFGLLAITMIFLVPSLVLLTGWSVAAPVVVLERPRGLRALRRSRELVRGNGWRVFAVIAAFTIAFDLVDRALEAGASTFGTAPGLAVTIVIWVLALPIPVLVATVLYFDLAEEAATDQPRNATAPPLPLPPQDVSLPDPAAASSG